MYLKSIGLHNFRCFNELKIDFDPNLTVIVGKNGAGKTAILEAIAIALSTWFIGFDNISGKNIDKKRDPKKEGYMIGGQDDVQSQFPVEIKASAVAGRIPEIIEWKRSLNTSKGSLTTKDAKNIIAYASDTQKALSKGDKSVSLPVVAYYGTGRLWDYHRLRKEGNSRVSARQNGYLNSLDGTANAKLMMNWFQRMTVTKYQRMEEGLGPIYALETVYKAMEECLTELSGCRDAKVKYNVNTYELEVYYSQETGERIKLAVSQLSDGYKGMLSLVADVAYRMAVLNPQFEENILDKCEGLILIDEIDLHLHPAWQQKAIVILQKLFPKVQFIITSHAPTVINSVKRENLRILDNKNVYIPDYESYGKDVNSVLEEIMGADTRPSEITTMFNEFYELMQEKQYEKAEEILDDIHELRKGHDPQVVTERTKLKLEKIRNQMGRKNDTDL